MRTTWISVTKKQNEEQNERVKPKHCIISSALAMPPLLRRAEWFCLDLMILRFTQCVSLGIYASWPSSFICLLKYRELHCSTYFQLSDMHMDTRVGPY